MKAYIRTFSFEACVFYLILIPYKLVNYLLVRGTMGIILRIFVIYILLKYSYAQYYVECYEQYYVI